jgi:hypothetical protein
VDGTRRASKPIVIERARPKHPSERRLARTYVTIVSKNPETMKGLESYFGSVGVFSHCVRLADDLQAIAPDFATATVIFPDDFDEADILALLRQVRRLRPRLLALLVTREPQRFRTATEPDGTSLPPIVLPKPSFGWDIVDTIRAHAAT